MSRCDDEIRCPTGDAERVSLWMLHDGHASRRRFDALRATRDTVDIVDCTGVAAGIRCPAGDARHEAGSDHLFCRDVCVIY